MARAGSYRHRIVIEQPSEVAEATYGQPVPTWAEFALVWADVQPVSGNERFIAQQFLANVTHTIRMLWLDDVTPKMRAKWGTRVFPFSAVINAGERDKELIITATEEVPLRA